MVIGCVGAGDIENGGGLRIEAVRLRTGMRSQGLQPRSSGACGPSGVAVPVNPPLLCLLEGG